MPAVYTLEYELKREDMAAWLHEALRRNGPAWLYRTGETWSSYVFLFVLPLTVGVLVAFVILWLGELIFGRPAPLEASAPIYGIGILAAFVSLVLNLEKVRKKAIDGMVDQKIKGKGGQKFILGWRELTVSSEGIVAKNREGETARKWSSVTEIQPTDSHVFIWSDITFIVPRRAFRSEADFRKFVEAVKELQRQGEKPREIVF